MTLFGTSGIRGLAGWEITPQLLLDLGRAIGSIHRRCIVGRDPRTTGAMLQEAFMAGLGASGAHGYDAGMVSTPTLALATRHFDAGAMITASHNPPEYNGVKLWNPNGMGFDAGQREEVEALMGSQDFRAPDWRGVGTRRTYPRAVEDHLELILKGVPSTKGKVIVDCGCGATSNIGPLALRALGCQVLGLNCQPDGTFPARDPEPSEENLGLLKAAVKGTGAKLGVAHDGDGDRMVAVDERGEVVGGDRLLALFASAEGKHRIVVPVDASMVLEDYLGGVEVVRTRVGDVYVAEEVARRRADFGGEPSGTWIFPRHSLCPDGVYAAARLASLLGDGKLSALLANIPAYPLRRKSYGFPRESRSKVQGALESKLTELKPREISTVDGWRLQFDEGWALVRLSGTEPKVRITVEARREADADEMLRRTSATVKEALS